MDFDERFDLDEFIAHINELHLVDNEDGLHKLIARTTKDTRGGDAFSFKPTRLWVGSSSGRPRQFHAGFACDIDPKGLNPQREGVGELSERDLPSSFWIRFIGSSEGEEKFQFRVFCSGQSISALRPYECTLPFSDVIPGGIQLRAQKVGSRVHAHLTVSSRRPPRAIVRLVPVILGRDRIYDRLATEADFFQPPHNGNSNEAEAGAISPLGSDQAVVKVGLWLTHRFLFDLSDRHYKLLWQCMVRLRLLHLEPDWSACHVPLPPTICSSWPAELSSFEIRYLVEGLISNGVISESELDSLRKALQRYSFSDWPVILEGFFKGNRKGSFEKDVKDFLRRMGPVRPVPAHRILVRRCLVTPTRCILQPPQLETSNSMLRAFEQYRDRFIRVRFQDEDEGLQITSDILDIDAAMDHQKGIFARLRRALRSGLHIAGRRYVFLCFGESQIRERGCWMISETEDFTVQTLLNWIGDLSEERIIAKHAARQGLVLSTSRGINLDDLRIRVESDLADITITESGATYTFTDGVGQCRQDLIDLCARTMGQQAPSSAVQVRVRGGTKGVLCAVPEAMLGANLVKVRKSMVKFKSDNKMLNVLKVSSYGIAYLNRQAILLLEEQGVPPEALLQLFLQEKGRVEGLEQNCEAERTALLTKFPVAQAMSCGFAQDPLVQNIIRVLKCRLLSDLKWKARVPVEKGAYLMGECVADETRTLQEGEVFCQTDGPSGRRVVTGTCTVFKNPCRQWRENVLSTVLLTELPAVHPGDIRLVKAVENPSLSHLRNVIVFPTYGARDLPNMMAGGDLDGDCYTLIWDETLIIPREHEPMDYSPPVSVKVPPGTTITVEDTKEFWLKYVQNDILGMICNSHMAWADKYGPRCTECFSLAKMASQAVDFSKTGVPVDRGSYFPPPSYPDFMGRDRKPTACWGRKERPAPSHCSDKVLGAMFRSIDPDPLYEPADAEPGWGLGGLLDFGANRVFQPAGSGWGKLLSTPLPTGAWAAYLREAAALRTRYDFELNGVLRTYRICEAECVAGVLLRPRVLRVRLDRDYSLRETVNDAYDDLAALFKAHAAQYLASHAITADDIESRRAWALACYTVTHDKAHSRDLDLDLDLERQTEPDAGDEAGLRRGLEDAAPARHYSFPWLFHEDLCGLADGGLRKSTVYRAPLPAWLP